ncbi:MAG: TAXI family TRAP transporter solute-binding subunit [Candidatus Rokubacteria bacterium]|nr:TAXI family TRAP transporter solute-binding subunit [Candidatus Rokubacteria bacterium]
MKAIRLAQTCLVACLATLVLASPDAVGGDATPGLRIATGQGVPHMVGLGMESVFNRFGPGLKAESADYPDEGEIVHLVRQRKAELGIVPIPEIQRALPSPKEREDSGLRFVMGGHAAIVLHVFLSADAAVLPGMSLASLRGKRVAVPEPGTPGEALVDAVLRAHALSRTEIQARPMGVQEQVRALREGKVDAALMVVPVASPVVPSPGPTRLMETRRARLIGLDPAAIEKVLASDPAFSRHLIEAGTYPGLDASVLTVARKNAVITHQDVGDELIYGFVRTILENPHEFQKVCPLGMEYNLKNVLPGTSLLPLHPGAERYLREKGIL